MAVSADAIRTHLEYTAWASQRLLDAASALTPEELTRDFQTSDHSVLGTLAHLFASDRVWLWRVQGDPRNTFLEPEDLDLARLREAWPAVLRAWREWAAKLTDERALAELSYRDRAGNPYRQPIWQIILHVVNHDTHHRGMVVGFIRSMGHKPPAVDLIQFYRAKSA